MRKSRRSVRQLGQSIDIINIILGVTIVVLAIVVVVTGGEPKVLFPIIFGTEAIINLLAGIKQVVSDELSKAIVLFAATLFMAAVTVASVIIIL